MKHDILITGVNGFIGKAIAQNLIIDNNLAGFSRAECNKTKLPIIYNRVDITDYESLNKISDSFIPDVIVHCAAAISNDNFTHSLIDTNVRGMENLLKFAKQIGCRKIVYISSLPVIGLPCFLPIREKHPVYPRTIYHLTKYFGEVLLQTADESIDIVILRLPSPIGAGMPANKILPVFINQCLHNGPLSLKGHGGRIQNYINVKDIALAVRNAITHSAVGVFNIAYSQSYSNLELAEMCKRVLRSNSEICFSGEDPDENIQWIYSIEKAIAELDFCPSISLEESIIEIAGTLKK